MHRSRALAGGNVYNLSIEFRTLADANNSGVGGIWDFRGVLNDRLIAARVMFPL